MTANLPLVLLWLAFALTVAAAIPRLGVPLWIPVLLPAAGKERGLSMLPVVG